MFRYLSCSLALAAIHLSPLRAALVFEKPDVEITAQPADEWAAAVFPFRIAGDKPIEITQVRTSCDCTTTQLTKKFYQPGEKGEIKAVFVFGGRTGDQFKQIAVKAVSDGKEQVYKLSFLVHVPELAALSPVALFWNVGEKASKRTIDILCPTEAAVSVQAVAESNEAKIEVATVRQGKAYQLKVRPTATDVPLREKILVTVDFGKAGKRTYDAYVYVK